jgi:hypothetical protein
VRVIGDRGVKVRLAGPQTVEISPGDAALVQPGEYAIEAHFGDAWEAAGSAEITDGTTPTIRCVRMTGQCSVSGQ